MKICMFQSSFICIFRKISKFVKKIYNQKMTVKDNNIKYL